MAEACSNLAIRVDPIVEPLIEKITEISQQLDVLRSMVTTKTGDTTALYKAATLVTRKEAARLLSISESQLDRETNKGRIAAIIVDRRPRYCLTDLEKYVNSRRIAVHRKNSERSKHEKESFS